MKLTRQIKPSAEECTNIIVLLPTHRDLPPSSQHQFDSTKGLIISNGSQLVWVQAPASFGEAPVCHSLMKGLCTYPCLSSGLGNTWHQSRCAAHAAFGSDLNGDEDAQFPLAQFPPNPLQQQWWLSHRCIPTCCRDLGQHRGSLHPSVFGLTAGQSVNRGESREAFEVGRPQSSFRMHTPLKNPNHQTVITSNQYWLELKTEMYGQKKST